MPNVLLVQLLGIYNYQHINACASTVFMMLLINYSVVLAIHFVRLAQIIRHVQIVILQTL
jgi:hypothetical protein